MPNDLKISGNQETLNVQVHYDTLELYGKVDATRPVTICRQ